MNRPISIALTALALASGAFQRASADGPPIMVSDCRGGIASIELVEIAGYNVTFRNTAAVTADEVDLAIPYGRRKTATFDVRGTFPPNVDVQKALRKTVSGGLYAYESDKNTCNVQHVHFTDGTTWDRPQS